MEPLTAGIIAATSLIAGFLIGRYWRGNLTSLGRVNEQIAEIKTKFDEWEQRRAALEEEREDRRERRREQWENFLSLQQERTEDLTESVQQFQTVLFGTKQRGKSGEAVLQHYLEDGIKAGLIHTDVSTGNGTVEFAVELDDTTYLPIDSKLPDVIDAVQEYDEAEPERQAEITDTITTKMQRAIRSVTKYVNQEYTTNKAILAAPDTVINIAPELVEHARHDNIYLTSYQNTFLIAYLLYEEYQRRQDQGELGEYKQLVDELHTVLDDIKEKTDTINRGIKQVQNANDTIKETIRNGKQ